MIHAAGMGLEQEMGVQAHDRGEGGGGASWDQAHDKGGQAGFCGAGLLGVGAG